jgi:hypothetical protein
MKIGIDRERTGNLCIKVDMEDRIGSEFARTELRVKFGVSLRFLRGCNLPTI